MNAARAAPPGFTLLELLVAMTLLALLAGLLFGGLGFGVRVWERGEAELDTLAELQIAHDLIRRVVGRPMLSVLADEAGEEGAIFEGTADGLRLVGPSPALALPGGIYRLGLGTDQRAGKIRLVLTWRPLVAGDDAPPPDADDNVAVLVDDIDRVRFSYFGTDDADEGEAGWLDQWPGAAGPPRLVRIDVTFAEGDRRRWPPLIVAPLVVVPAL
ncbi:MAG: prepilin-type N-terminal cleavage/methylation domain-containing protein [Rhodospirillales bacterium]